ncbi:hypothetical protein [Spiroplasma endosymbiont of Virgichneumon dumeticola]|uniref:hypothetical protein n=1 Tax=Spiroplasma endosymbiont of Virgichneumon dumeticola TaxID=3139323 RepID=UPI0035C8D0EF
MKIIVNNNQLINIINDDWQKNIIELATYKTLLKENINYEKDLIRDIQFLTALKEELNTNILNFDFEELDHIIVTKCWREYISYFNQSLNYWYFDLNLKERIINEYNYFIKHSSQNQKQQIIINNFKSHNQKKEYENWKHNYFKNINEKITKNNIEQGIDVFEYFKDEINSIDLRNQASTNQYKLKIQVEVI